MPAHAQSDFHVTIDEDEYTVTARSCLDAAYQAASKHKRHLGGPFVGIGVEDYARQATVESTGS